MGCSCTCYTVLNKKYSWWALRLTSTIVKIIIAVTVLCFKQVSILQCVT